MQFTVDSDCNISDSKPDAAELITASGELRLGEQKLVNDKLYIKGVLCYTVLYASEEGGAALQSMYGEIPFDEVMNIDGCNGGESLMINKYIEDISAMLIHSRKVNIKAVIALEALAEELCDEEAAVSVTEEAAGVQLLTDTVTISSMAVDARDSHRIRESIVLPNDRPDMNEIIYRDIAMRGCEVRAGDDKLGIKAELNVFFVYIGAGSEAPIGFYETDIPVNISLECMGCSENMIPFVAVELAKTELSIRPDEDGEERVAELEAVFDVKIRAYEETETEIIRDLYGTKSCLTPVYSDAVYENLLMRNSTKLWISGTERLPAEAAPPMRICHAGGEVRLDNTYIVSGDAEEGIAAEGAVTVTVFYVTGDDKSPIRAVKTDIPFSRVIDVRGIRPDSCYNIITGIDQINVIMSDSTELEIKAGVTLNTIAFASTHESFITDCREEELDIAELRSRPAMTGYVVAENDTLWDIAKRFRTTGEDIAELNELTGEPAVGDRLLIIRELGLE